MSIHVGIFGPSLCGKSHAAKQLSAARWRNHRRRALVLDLNADDWGPHSLVYTLPPEVRDPPAGVNVTDEQRRAAIDDLVGRFLAKMWALRDLDVFIDEATETVGRSTDFTGVFTRGRHRGHVVYAMGHAATVLLPIQRDQFGTLLLFRQSPKAARIWSEEWAEPRMEAATTLKKYEFIFCKKFAAPDGSHLVSPGKF